MVGEGVEVLVPSYVHALVISRGANLDLPLAMSVGRSSLQDGLLAAVDQLYRTNYYLAVAQDEDNQAVLVKAFRSGKSALVKGGFGSVLLLHPTKGLKVWLEACSIVGMPTAMLVAHLRRLLQSLYDDAVVIAQIETTKPEWYQSRFEAGCGPVFNLEAETE